MPSRIEGASVSSTNLVDEYLQAGMIVIIVIIMMIMINDHDHDHDRHDHHHDRSS